MTNHRIALALSALALTSIASLAWAQQAHRRRTPPPAPHAIPMAGTVIDWSVFVSAYGEAASSRTTIPITPTAVTLPAATGWSCSVSVPTRAAVDGDHWSEVRTLECQHGDAILSTTGFCQIASASWGARAAVLSLGSTTVAERIQVTVDCAVRN